MIRFVLFIAALLPPLAAQLPPPVITSAPRVATVSVAIRFQCGWRSCSKAVVTLYNPASFKVDVSRAQILVAPEALSVVQLTRDQAASQQSNSLFAVIGRVGSELGTLAPGAMSAAGIAAKSQTLGFWGVGLAFGMFLVQRATARAQPVGTELADVITLAANGGGEFVLHVVKVRRKAAVNVSFRIEVTQ
jgi:hypothetical protein